MKHRLNFLLGLTLLAALALTAAADPISVKDLKLEVPENWYVVEIPTEGDSVRAIIASDQSAELQAMMIVTQVPKKNRTLDGMMTVARNQIITRMDGVIQLADKQDVAGERAFTLGYTGRSSLEDKGVRSFRRTVVQHGEDFYVLQAVAEPTNFANHAGAIESMVKGATWSEPDSSTDSEDYNYEK